MMEILLTNKVDLGPIRLTKEERSDHFSHHWFNYFSALATAIRHVGEERRNGHIIQRLIDAGSDPNSVVTEDPYLTALLLAVEVKSHLAVDALISNGADPNLTVPCGVDRTPLQLAAELGSIEITQTLLKAGADVNVPAFICCGATALQYAAIYGFLGIACLLLENGASVDAPRAKVDGRTALEAAAEHGHIHMIQLLLDAGAQVTGPGSTQYERSRELAKRNGNFAACRMLEAHHQHVVESGFADFGQPFDLGNQPTLFGGKCII